MLKKVLLTLFAGYTISLFLSNNYQNHPFLLFLGTTLLAAVLYLPGNENVFSKATTNLTASIQYKYLIFYILPAKVSNGALTRLVHTDIIIIAVLFVLLTWTDKGKYHLFRYLIHSVSVATAMGLALKLFGESHLPLAGIFTWTLPITTSFFLLLFVNESNFSLGYIVLNAIISFGIALGLPKEINILHSQTVWNMKEFMYVNTWLSTLLSGFIYWFKRLKGMVPQIPHYSEASSKVQFSNNQEQLSGIDDNNTIDDENVYTDFNSTSEKDLKAWNQKVLNTEGDLF